MVIKSNNPQKLARSVRERMSSRIPVSLLLICCLIGLTQCQDQLTVSTEPPIGTCEPITEITMCLNINWENASFPNLREHTTQRDANNELNGYLPLVNQRCSNAIVHFLCSVYAPFCTIIQDRPITLSPCRELCQYVRDSCEPVLVRNLFQWPSHLNCENFPSAADIDGTIEKLCLDIPGIEMLTIPTDIVSPEPTAPMVSVSPLTVTSSSSSSSRVVSSENPTPTNGPGSMSGLNENRSTPVCPTPLSLSGHTLANSSYVFANIKDCAVRCEGIYFTEVERNSVAPAFILICAILCIGFTLFTVGTFMIDRHRYHYPERPVIFLALCYLVLSFAFVVGSVVKLRDASGSFSCSDTKESKSFIFQRLPDASPTYHSASCVILFIFIYYFQMAAAIWWVVLTLTWFMASTLKWGEEAVERPWILYHILAWCVPAIQVILILALQLVDGDQLSGTCFTGNHHNIGMGVFVLLPLIAYLLVGILFLMIGFLSLVNILRQISKDPHKSRRLTRLIIRILIYGLLYIIPNVIYICLCIYEVAERNEWEKAYVDCHETGKCLPSPQFAALLIRYVMLFVIGIFSTFWVISWKTIVAWRNFFESIFLCRQESNYALPSKKETPI